jgi:hypothetical protein
MTKYDDLHQYQYLWDGSQPGWELIHIAGHKIALSLQFCLPGGSARERMFNEGREPAGDGNRFTNSKSLFMAAFNPDDEYSYFSFPWQKTDDQARLYGHRKSFHQNR